MLLPDDLADDEPALAQLTVAAVSGVAPAGPERREREPLRIARTPGATVSARARPATQAGNHGAWLSATDAR